MNERTQLATIETIKLPDLATVETELKEIRAFQSKVKSLMIEGHDYGVIPGTEKPTLLKPGAEKITKILNCRPAFEELEKVEDWEKPFFYYKFKCALIHFASGQVVDEGYGSCNSMESRYRWRWVFASELPPGIDISLLISKTFKGKKGQDLKKYRIENDDIYTQANTILKMAKKRALVDAALSLGRLSDIFTQDMEDIAQPVIDIEDEETSVTQSSPKPTKETNKKQTDLPQSASEKQINFIKNLVQKKLQGDWSIICKEYGFLDEQDACANLNIEQGNDIIQWLQSL